MSAHPAATRSRSGARACAPRAAPRARGAVVGALALLALPGCAVEWHDPATDTTHVLGFGHLSMSKRRADDGTVAVVTQVDTLGLGLASTPDGVSLNLGLSRRQRAEILAEDTALTLRWTAPDLHSLHASRSWPALATPSHEETASR